MIKFHENHKSIERNFNRSLLFFSVICQLFGYLDTFEKPPKHLNSRSKLLRRLALIYTWLVRIAMYIFITYVYTLGMKSVKESFTKFIDLSNILVSLISWYYRVSYPIGSAISLLVLSVNRNKLQTILNRLYNIDCTYHTLGYYINYFCIWPICVWFVFQLTVYALTVYVMAIRLEWIDIAFLLRICVAVSMLMYALHFIVYATLICERFIALNDILTRVISNKFSHTHPLVDLQATPVWRARMFPKTHVTRALDIVAHAHHELFTCVNEHNYTFSLPFIVYFGLFFLSLLSVVYTLVVTEILTFNHYTNCASTLIIVALDLGFMIWRSAKTESTADKSLVLLAQVRQVHPHLIEQVSLMQLQLQHEKITFSPLELFPINYTLSYSLIAACTTYVIILIQFDPKSQ